MKVIRPFTMSESNLVSSNIPEDLPRSSSAVNYNKWSASTAYVTNDLVCFVFTIEFGFLWPSGEPIMFGGAGFYSFGQRVPAGYPVYNGQTYIAPGTYFGVFKAKYSQTNFEPMKYSQNFSDTTFPGYSIWSMQAYAPVYDPNITYVASQTVGYSGASTGALYQSLVSPNFNNTPSSSPTYWKQITADSYATWNSGTTYANGDYVVIFNGLVGSIFKSIQGSNLNHDPQVNPSWWTFIGQTYKQWASGTSYSVGDIVISLATHKEYEALQAGSGHDPTNQLANTYWLERQSTNKWRMFDLLNSTQSSAGDLIDVSVQTTGYIDSVALMNCDVREITIVAKVLDAVNLNILLYTEAPTLGSWTFSGTMTHSENVVNAPDGEKTADSITIGTSNNQERLEWNGGVTQPNTWNYSCHLKKNTGRYAALGRYDGAAEPHAIFDLQEGVITYSTGLNASGIIDCGDGFYRCWIDITAPSGSGSGWKLWPINNPTNYSLSTAGNSIYHWGMQVTVGHSLQPYQSVAAAYSGYKITYSKTFDVTDSSGITDWHAYFFEQLTNKSDFSVTDIPMYNNQIIRIIGRNTGGTAAIGSAVIGKSLELGEVLWGVKAGINDFSKKEQNDFGDWTVVPRNYAKRSTMKIAIEPDQVDTVITSLANLRAIPCVYLGTVDYLATLIYGFFKSYEVEISYPTVSYMSIEIEGLV